MSPHGIAVGDVVAYHHHPLDADNVYVVVCDHGGGSFDIKMAHASAEVAGLALQNRWVYGVVPAQLTVLRKAA